MPITYRPVCSAAELDTLLGRESHYSDFTYQYETDTIELLKDHFDLALSLYLFALDGEEFAGFVSCDTDWWEPDSFFIRELFVDPAHQRRQIGRILMQKCLDHAKLHNAAMVVTQTAHENIPMQALCESFGFARWENPRWNEGITYKLFLEK